MEDDKIEEIKEQFPFLTGIKHGGKEYIAIVQNSDDKVITFYDIESTSSKEETKELLEMGDIWYWESNRKIPINIFLKGKMKRFSHCMKTVYKKDTEILFGPITSLNNILKKRIKRRQIKLVKDEK